MLRHSWKAALAAAALSMVSAAGLLAIASPASADPTTVCEYRNSVHLDSGYTVANVHLYYCSSLNSWWWRLDGTVHDTSCDGYTAYLDLYRNGGSQYTITADGGCGTYKSGTAIYYGPANSFYARTRACWIGGCKPQDSEHLYPS